MTLYPYILSRLGGLPFHYLSSIQITEQAALDEYITKKLKNEALSEADKDLIVSFEANFESFYSSATQNARKVLHELAGNDVLRKGLLQSSHSFVERVEKYRQHPIEEFRKKERQTERSVAQYLARSAAKTSPFSTFTNLSINQLDGQAPHYSDGEMYSKIRINNYLLAYLKDLLSNFDPFFVQLELKLNASMYRENNEYVFLLNSRNVESIQRIEEDGVIEKIIEIIAFFKGKVDFRQMVVELKEVVDADPAELGLYILQLQRYGLLEWHWPVSGNDTNWDTQLLDWIKGMKPFTLRGQLVNSLELLRSNGKAYETADVDTRKKLVLESYTSIKECCGQLKSGQWEEVPADQTAFSHFEAGEFIFIPERLYYEDTERSVHLDLNQNELKESMTELDELLQLIAPLQMNEMAVKVQHFYEDHYKGQGRIRLMNFHSTFFQEKNWRLDPVYEEKRILREEFCEKLGEGIRYSDEFTINLSLSDLRMIVAQKELGSMPPQSAYSYGALVQFFATGGTYKSYVDATFTGYGKMLGRFLHLFPQTQTDELTAWINDLRNNDCWVDNVDASIFNANAHPPLLPLEISMPGSQNKLAPADQIQVADLEIGLDETTNELKLFHGEKEVSIFDLGLEALSSRSPLYQLLAVFGKPQPKIGLLKMLLVSVTRKEEGAWVKLPRVNIGEKLILQRKTWGVPNSDLPLRGTNETESAYFLRLNIWRAKYQLPQQVFITLNPVEFNKSEETKTDKRAGDLYKPQYIDFSSSALVSHFGRELAKVTGYLKLEEMLPGSDEMLKVGGEATVSELMLIWEGIMNN